MERNGQKFYVRQGERFIHMVWLCNAKRQHGYFYLAQNFGGMFIDDFFGVDRR